MMVGMRGRLGWLTIIVAGLALAACGVESPQATDPAPATSPTPGDGAAKDRNDTRDPPANPAPDFTVTTFDGTRFSLSEQRGSPVVLNFWESW
jgi:cytochrome oxidase Cu insertion factor (SCO1/SenC/PrrC family)